MPLPEKTEEVAEDILVTATSLLPVLWLSASLSLFGGLCVVIDYFRNRTDRGLSLKIILFMTCANLGTCVGFLLQNPNIEIQCLTAAAIVNFFSVSSFLWSCCLAFNLYLTVFLKSMPSKTYVMTYFIGFCLTIPTICVALPLYFDMYTHTFADDAIGCWYKKEYVWGRFIFSDGWIMIAWSVNLLVYTLVVRHKSSIVMENLYVQQNPGLVKSAIKKQKVIGILLLIFVICWTWSIVLAFFSLFDIDSTQPSTVWVLYMFCIFVPLQAFINFIMFLWKSPEFRMHHVLMWMKLFSYCACNFQYTRLSTQEVDEEWPENNILDYDDDDLLSLRDS